MFDYLIVSLKQRLIQSFGFHLTHISSESGLFFFISFIKEDTIQTHSILSVPVILLVCIEPIESSKRTLLNDNNSASDSFSPGQ